MKRTLLVLFVVAAVSSVAPASSVATQETTVAQENGTEYPPGLSAEGVTDPLALADAHRETLRDTSYTVVTSATFARSNGSLLSRNTATVRVAPGGSSYYGTTSQSRANDTRPLGVGRYDVAVWANETGAVLAERAGSDEPSYRRVDRDRAPMEPTRQWELLYAAFGATNATVVEQFERDGATLFRVVSTDQPGSASAYSERSGYGFVAVVDSQGVVHSFQQTYRTSFSDRPAVVSRTVQFTRIGNTTVERPDWYDEAVANASESAGG